MPGWKLEQAARRIREGGIVAYPTEAVFGLGCDPFNYQAVSRLLELKQREVGKGLIVLVSDKTKLLELLAGELDKEQLAVLDASWPGPTTYLLPLADYFPRWITGSHDKVAVRVTDHPLAAELTHLSGGFLVSTSANIAEQKPAKTALQVRQAFGSALDGILDGDTSGLQKPTSIVDIVSAKTIRE